MNFRLLLCVCLTVLFLPHTLLAKDDPYLWIPKLHGLIGPMQYKTFESAAAGTEVGYTIYLPLAYDKHPQQRFPVVYWLHGYNGTPGIALDMVRPLQTAIHKGEAIPFIVVGCADPTKKSLWCDTKSGKYPIESIIVHELIPYIDANYRTIANREGRAIEGFSIGGFGAAHLGFKYPELFGAVSLLAGTFYDETALMKERYHIFTEIFGEDLTYARMNTPWTIAKENADKIRDSVVIRMVIGEDDRAVMESNRSFHAFLNELNIPHHYIPVPGTGHSSGKLYEKYPGNPFAFYEKVFGKETVSE